jgi:hypothetical protein
MSPHAAWIEATKPALLEGDADAIAEIRRLTLAAADAPADDEAPVYLWNGIWVKGEGDASHAVPERISSLYVRTAPPPAVPTAIWPDGTPRPAAAAKETDRERFLSMSLGKAEGAQRGIDEIVLRTRLALEIVPDMFPADVELHWFPNGLYVVGPGDSPSIYQTPMSRVEDLIRPREYPLTPQIRDFMRRG